MRETVFTYGSPQLKFGPGAAEEIGYDLSQLGATRALLVTDAAFAATGHPQRVAEQMAAYDVAAVVYDGARVEPTDDSMREAAAFGREHGPFDAIVAVGGGSAIDTAKAVNLLTTNDGDLADYLNAPIGQGRAPQRPLLPFVAVPTTAGTGSESTTVCVLDVLSLQVKTGISHPRLRPTLAVVDPVLTMSLPPMVTACSGLDILCHALESYTTRPYDERERKRPEQRVPYCGANPVSDLWCEQALSLLGRSFRTAVHEGADESARHDMALAATVAGMGFGNAGLHIPHANAYPIAGRVRGYHPADYPGEEAMVPHGMSVALTAPAAFRFTFEAAPERHLRAAALLDPSVGSGGDAETLPRVVAELMRDIGMPDGLAAVGYADSDVDDLVAGSLQQERLLAGAPRDVGADELAGIFRASMTL